jgi:hypothetical protein
MNKTIFFWISTGCLLSKKAWGGLQVQRKHLTADNIFPTDELVKILKHEAKILLDLLEVKNEDLQSQEGRRENLSSTRFLEKENPIVPQTNAMQRMAPSLGIRWK